MISYVTGVLGSGKSLYGARASARALLQGKVVASNVRFVPGWEKRVLEHSPYYKFAGKHSRQKQRDELLRRYYYEPDFGRLLSARIRGKGQGRGLRVFDEAHNEINNREWEKENQKIMLKRFSLSRKRGWDDLVISQHMKNTDAAVRRISGIEIKMIDWKQLMRLPVIGTEFLPFHAFLAMAYPVEESGNAHMQSVRKKLFSEFFLLGWWKDLYDTMEDYELDDEVAAEAVWLPFAAGGARGETAALADAGVQRTLVGAGGHPLTKEPPDAITL